MRFGPTQDPDSLDANELRQAIASARAEIASLELRANELAEQRNVDEASEAVQRFRLALARRELETKRQELEYLLRRAGQVATDIAGHAAPQQAAVAPATDFPPAARTPAFDAQPESAVPPARTRARRRVPVAVAGLVLLVLAVAAGIWAMRAPSAETPRAPASSPQAVVSTGPAQRDVFGRPASNADATALTAASTAAVLTQVAQIAQLPPTATPPIPTPTPVVSTVTPVVPTLTPLVPTPEPAPPVMLNEDESLPSDEAEEADTEPEEDIEPVVVVIEPPAPTPIPRPTPVPVPVRTARIYAPGFADVRVRATPSFNGTVVRSLPVGTVVQLVGGPVTVAGTEWQQIRAPGGAVGWVTTGTLN
jgi:hypothetical protein